MIKRYGAKTTMQSKELAEKVRKTKLEKYGDANFINLEKARETMIERYGVENPFQMQSVRDKIDYTKVANIVLDEFRNGKIGNITLEEVE